MFPELHRSSRTAGNIAFRSFAAEMQLAEIFDPSCAKVNDNPQNAAPALAPLLPVQRLRIVRGSQISSPYKSDAAPAMMTPMNAIRAKLDICTISIAFLGDHREAYDKGTMTICTKTLRVLFAYLAKSLMLTACPLISHLPTRAKVHKSWCSPSFRSYRSLTGEVLAKDGTCRPLTKGSYIHPAEKRPAVSRTRDCVARLDQCSVHATTRLFTSPRQHPNDRGYTQYRFNIEEPAESSWVDPVEW
jgi:hypothetical protein